MIIWRFLLLIVSTCFAIQLFAAPVIVDDSDSFDGYESQSVEVSDAVPSNDYDDFRSPASNSDEQPLVNNADSTDSNDDMSSANFLNKIRVLQQEIQELRGQLEVQMHDLKMLQQQQVTFYKDLDSRIRKNNTHGDAKSTSHPKSSEDTLNAIDSAQTQSNLNETDYHDKNINDEQLSYLAAYEQVKQKNYNQAIAAMSAFIAQYPRSSYTPNAQYWLGELYLVEKQYDKAIKCFKTVISEHTTSSKVAPALLKLGYALADMGKFNEARTYLEQVVNAYPDTNTAHLAAARLRSL